MIKVAWMSEQEIAEKFASDINGVVEDWFWTRDDAIKALQQITEIEDDTSEVIIQFWMQVQHEGDFLETTDIFNRENDWMEPGVAYTMGAEGWESWEDPRSNY